MVVPGRGGPIPLHASGAGLDAPESWAGSFSASWSCGQSHCEEAPPERWLGADGNLHLDVGAPGPGGASAPPAAVALDYLELRVRYWRTGCEAAGEGRPGTPEGTPCSDGDPGTEGETCRAGRCVAP